MQAVCQQHKPFKLWGFFRSTAGDGCFRAGLPHHDGASFAIAVQQRVVPDISPEELAEVFEVTLTLAVADSPRPTFTLRIGGVYGNNRQGSEWSVHRIVDEHPSPMSEFDLVVYEIVKVPGRADAPTLASAPNSCAGRAAGYGSGRGRNRRQAHGLACRTTVQLFDRNGLEVAYRP